MYYVYVFMYVVCHMLCYQLLLSFPIECFASKLISYLINVYLFLDSLYASLNMVVATSLHCSYIVDVVLVCSSCCVPSLYDDIIVSLVDNSVVYKNIWISVCKYVCV